MGHTNDMQADHYGTSAPVHYSTALRLMEGTVCGGWHAEGGIHISYYILNL